MSKFTKQAIFASFLKLLNERPLDRITVKDIVEDCGVNRKTFYYYFQDIYALADDLTRQTLENIAEQYPPEQYSWNESVKFLADYVLKNKKAVLHIYNSVGYGGFAKSFYKIGMEYMPLLLSEQSEGMNVTNDDIQFISGIYATIISGMFSGWIAEGITHNPVEEIDRLTLILKGTVKLELENAQRINNGENE